MARGGKKGGGGGNGTRKSSPSSSTSNDTKPAGDQNDDGGNQFGSYLRSEDGMNSMKMFVIVNSIVMILTMGWPAMKQAYEIIYEKLLEWELI